MDMSGMDMGGMSSNTTSSMGMMAVFFTSTTTPLYSSSWTPTTTGTYAATCIFIIVLAVIFRFLIAIKTWKEAAWLDAEIQRRYVHVAGKGDLAARMSQDSDMKKMVLSENGLEEQVVVVKKHGMNTRPWRITTDPIRAVIDTTIAGVGYLLMLAVMSMNVGYFISVLSGTFLGSLVIGRYSPINGH